MKKQALNKYETYLYNQPTGRKFENVRIQRTYDDLQKAKFIFKNADSMKALPRGSTSSDIGSHAFRLEKYKNKAKNLIRDSRSPPIPRSMYMNRHGDTSFKNYAKAHLRGPSVTSTLSKDKNKFFQKAKTLFKRNPALLIPAGAVLGGIGYGIKKKLED